MIDGLLNGTLLEKMVGRVNCNNVTTMEIFQMKYMKGTDVNSDPTSLRLDCAVDIENSSCPEGINVHYNPREQS